MKWYEWLKPSMAKSLPEEMKPINEKYAKLIKAWMKKNA